MTRSTALTLLAAVALAGGSPTDGPGTPGEQGPETGVVSHVVDGNTIDVDPLGRVRLVGMDTPEQHMCSYAQATAAMTDLVLGRTVQLVHSDGVADTDPYGRCCATSTCPTAPTRAWPSSRPGGRAPPTTPPPATPGTPGKPPTGPRTPVPPTASAIPLSHPQLADHPCPMSAPGDMLKATETEEPTVTTTTWDHPAWAHIEAADPGLPALMATLQATAAACDAAIGLGQVTPAIDPFTGWATTTGILAGLILATNTTPPPDPAPLDTPPSDDAAAAVVDRLYRTAADQALTLGLDLRDQVPIPTTGGSDPHALPVLEALAATMSLLAASYTETFGRPW